MEKNPNEKTIFILGAGVMQVPAIRLGKENGWKVVCADQNSEAVGRNLCDTFLEIDIKESSLLIEAIEKYNRENSPVNGIFTCGTDFSYCVAVIADHFNLPGISPEAAKKATDKVQMREAFREAGVNSPWFFLVESENVIQKMVEDGVVSYPCVVKPADSMGARGVKKIEDKKDLFAAVADALKYSRSHRAIVEDFVSGLEFSLDAIIENGSVIITGIADRHIYFPPYFIEMGHTMPSCQPSNIREAVIEEFKKGIQALGLDLGAAKGDIRWDGKKAIVGEIAARLSGGYMSGWTYPYSSGVSPINAAMKLALGENPGDLEPKYQKVSAERAFISIPGVVSSIEGAAEVEKREGIKNIFFNIKKGDQVRFPVNNVEKCGNVISCHSNYSEAVKIADEAASSIIVRLDPENLETEEFLFSEEENIFPGDQFVFETDENKKWEQEIFSGKKFPPKFSKKLPFSLSQIESRGLPKELKIYSPPRLKEEKNPDWQGRSVEKAMEQIGDFYRKEGVAVDFLSLDDKNVLFKKINEDKIENDINLLFSYCFWQVFKRGSVQGAVWLIDRISCFRTNKSAGDDSSKEEK